MFIMLATGHKAHVPPGGNHDFRPYTSLQIKKNFVSKTLKLVFITKFSNLVQMFHMTSISFQITYH